MIWVTGPGGYGKTACVASYIQARDLPCLWFQVDSGDADLATFFYYLGLAGKKAAPRKRKPLPVLTPEYMLGIPKFSRNFFAELFNRLRPPAVLVFDNYHEVADDAPLHGALLEGLARIPERVAVILVSRGLPPPAFSRVRANRMMSQVGRQDLRFTLDEFKDVVKKWGYAKQGDKALREIHARMDGWIAGLHLLLENSVTSRNGSIKAGEETPQEIFDYFAAESFSQLDKKTQDFLLKTAWLPNMTSRMARTLTGNPQAGRILSYLYRNNFYTEKRPHSVAVYQYHPIFREFLLTHAKDAFPAKSLSILGRDAAMLLEDADETEAAIALLCDIGDWDTLAPLIIKHAPDMLAQGRNRTLKEWLSSLPKDMIENTPWLSYWMGACRMPFDPLLSQRHFEHAFERFKIQGDAAGIFLAWSGVVDSIVYGLEDFALLDKWIRALEQLMNDFGAFPSEEIGARVAQGMCKALVIRQPQHPEIEAWAERVLSLKEDRPAIINAKIETLFQIVFHQMGTGDFEKAALTIDSLGRLTRSGDAAPLALIITKLSEAIYYQMTGLREKCLKAVSDGLELSRTTGVHIMDHIILGHAIASALNANDCTTAGKWLDDMALTLSNLTAWGMSEYHFLKAREALLREDLEQASLHAGLALKFDTKAGNPFTLSWIHLMKAQVMHQLEKHGEATEHLAHAFSIARRIKSKLTKFYALLAEAQFALDQGEEASGLISLRKALAIGKERGYLNTWMDQPSVTARLCVRALEAGIEVEYVQDIIRKRNLVPDDPPMHLENWPWPLKIYTLGRFGLARDGKAVRSSGKAQQKPMALLKALIAFGGRQVSEGKIVDALWPDVDGDMQRQSLATTLHRLRKLLGIKDAIEFRDGKATLNPRYCWVDAWAFERLIRQADLSWKDNNKSDNAAVLTEKAIGLFKGPFLSEETDEPWSIHMRERLRDKFLRGLVKLGRHLEQAGQWEEAIEQYQNGLAVDPLVEECYQRLMSCYHSLGRAADAVATYQRCLKNLETALGVAPSPETEELYQKLRSGEAAD